jgi:N-acetylneuraminic acid mutarotase
MEFGNLPTSLAGHASFLVDNKYICIYGGTNGLTFFDNICRYDIEKKDWTIMCKYPISTNSNN